MKISLKKQLKQAIANSDNWESKYWSAKEKLDKFEEAERNKFKQRIDDYDRFNRDLYDMNHKLMEIVRWHVNPETAKKEPPVVNKYGNVLTNP